MKNVVRIVFAVVFLVVALGATASPVKSQGTAVPILVYLDPTVYEHSWRDWAPKFQHYVDDMNTVLVNSGVDWLYFTYDNNVSYQPDSPFDTGTEGCVYPANGFDYKVWFTGGTEFESLGADCSGDATAIMGILNYGSDILERDGLVEGGVDYYDYLNQLGGLIHEFAHGMGAGLPEYYTWHHAPDKTNAAPTVQISHEDDGDPWWNSSLYGGYDSAYVMGFRNDPMGAWEVSGTFEEFFSWYKFGGMSRVFLAGQFRGIRTTANVDWTNDIYGLSVTLRDSSGNVVPGKKIKAWYWVPDMRESWPQGPQGSNTLIGTYTTDSEGHASIPWDATENKRIRYITPSVLLKAYNADGTTVYGQSMIVNYYQLMNYEVQYGGHGAEYPVSMIEKGFIYGVSIPLSPAGTGWIVQNYAASAKGNLGIGDTHDNKGMRSIIQFDTRYLPDLATSTQAYLRVRGDPALQLGSTVGFGPSGHANDLTVQIGHPCVGGTCSLVLADYGATNVTLLGYMPTFETTGTEYTELTFTAGLSYLDKDGVTDLRLLFNKTTDNDGVADQVEIDNEQYGEVAPELFVYYTLP